MTTISLDTMSDRELLERIVCVAGEHRRLTADLLALIAECDTRRLYLGQGCSSLFTYCTQVLHLSEHAAYHRIECARASRQFPAILELISDGSVTLTTVALLRPHLTPDNHRELLAAASHRTRREVEHQIACLSPAPDAKPLIRRIPAHTPVERAVARQVNATSQAMPLSAAEPRVQVAALAADRYLLRVTLSADAHGKLRRAQELMGHHVPDGDPAAIIDKALSLLVDHLERAKLAKVQRPRAGSERGSESASTGGSRHIPAAMRRLVWARDAGRCAFVGARGRCTETGRLEFHHVVPFARGGATRVENLALRCRAHNAYKNDQAFGTHPQRGGRQMAQEPCSVRTELLVCK
ncbi:MAG TPA: HNH endonuclease signature motif containing protein [Vicinamibacterales bacterium]|nr:HNH endonuclease signature motif containing protein [Vicinamibacterales bacterium]